MNTPHIFITWQKYQEIAAGTSRLLYLPFGYKLSKGSIVDLMAEHPYNSKKEIVTVEVISYFSLYQSDRFDSRPSIYFKVVSDL